VFALAFSHWHVEEPGQWQILNLLLVVFAAKKSTETLTVWVRLALGTRAVYTPCKALFSIRELGTLLNAHSFYCKQSAQPDPHIASYKL
jgi:hypothetical protein